MKEVCPLCGLFISHGEVWPAGLGSVPPQYTDLRPGTGQVPSLHGECMLSFLTDLC
jgi:hypothetical protein